MTTLDPIERATDEFTFIVTVSGPKQQAMGNAMDLHASVKERIDKLNASGKAVTTQEISSLHRRLDPEGEDLSPEDRSAALVAELAAIRGAGRVGWSKEGGVDVILLVSGDVPEDLETQVAVAAEGIYGTEVPG